MADVIFNKAKAALLGADLDLDAHTIKAMLVTASYVPDIDNHDFVDDVTNQVTGTGYSAGGAALANKTVTQDNTNNRGKWDADDVAWTTASFTARGAVLYRDTGTPGTSTLIAYIDFGSDKTVTSGTFTIAWHSDGILLLS